MAVGLGPQATTPLAGIESPAGLLRPGELDLNGAVTGLVILAPCVSLSS